MQATALLAFLASTTLVASAAAQTEASPSRAERRLPVAKLRQIRSALETAGLYTKITPETRNDWMRAFPEDRGQTFHEYVRSKPRPMDEAQTRFYLANLAPESPAVKQAALLAKDFLAACFALQPAEVALSLPEQLPVNATGQINALPLVHKILPEAVDAVAKARKVTFVDGAGLVAITDRDLYLDDPENDERLNFLFGLSGTTAAVTVFSTARLGDPATGERARARFTRRVIGLAVHEFGHNCGLPHCTRHRCLMNGANNLSDMDGAPLLFCPDCLAKLWWYLALDPREHLQRMLTAMRVGDLEKVLADEIAVLEASLKVVATDGK
jgi:archaemetzincin